METGEGQHKMSRMSQ